MRGGATDTMGYMKFAVDFGIGALPYVIGGGFPVLGIQITYFLLEYYNHGFNLDY